MSITLQHIADHLKLSKATVSRSLRNDPLILPKTRAKVHATAVRMGYEGRQRGTRRRGKAGSTPAPNSSKSSGTLGLLFRASSLDQARHDANLVQIMEGAMAEAERTGMMVMVHTIQPHVALPEENSYEVPPMILQRVCQAVIVRGELPDEYIAFLADHLPVITVGRTYRGLPVDSVVPDSVGGVRALVAHLVGLGHRRLAWVGAYYNATFLEERQAGFVTGCLSNGLTLGEQNFLGPEIYENRRIDQEKLMQLVGMGTTALVCGNDSVATQVIKALEHKGVRVPQDVSVTGFDAAISSTDGGVRITSVNPRFVDLGRAAVRLANQRLDQGASPSCILTVQSELAPGETTAPITNE
jgi:LacI family transcriptional regulator